MELHLPFHLPLQRIVASQTPAHSSPQWAATTVADPTQTATSPGSDDLHQAAIAECGPPATTLSDPPQRTAARSRWTRLLARIYKVFPLLCPDCGAEMRIIAFITAAEPVDILSHLGLPTTPLPLSPARGPPQHDPAFDADPDFDLDQTPAYDGTEPEPAPDFDFAQSAGA